MKLLAIDSALDESSVAAWGGHGDPQMGSIREVICGVRGTASRELLPVIDRLLAAHGWSFSDLDAVALTIGPGSFTGLRIAVSLVKGLIASRPLRIAAVGTLEAVAVASGHSGRVAAVLDARRGEVYARLFHCGPGAAEPIGDEAVTTLGELASWLPSGAPVSCVGPGAVHHADALRALGPHVAIAQKPVMTAASAALLLGARRLVAGQDTLLDELFPRYVKRSNAEASLEGGVLGSRRRRMLGWDPAHGRN